MTRIDPTALWYGHHPLVWLLTPLSWLYCAIVALRRLAFRTGWLKSQVLPVPVIVVGNLSVGGTGKTPAVLRLAALLREHGWRPGILTRGYGGQAQTWPQWVRPESDPLAVGDEPVLLARRSGCPVLAGPDRVASGLLAIEQAGCDILLTDDGLQHYRLARDLEIAVVDGERGFGNGRCLPAGPLREPLNRLASVDLVLYNGGERGRGDGMRLVPGDAVNLGHPDRRRPLKHFRGQRVCAIAGIGNPGRFFAMLRAQGLEVDARPYPDHHRFAASDLAHRPDGPLLMTEKDAVKCARFSGDDHWYVPVEAVFDDALVAGFLTRLAGVTHG